MKIVLLSAANNVHTVKWANGLARSGIHVHVISLHGVTQDFDPRVSVHELPVKAPFGYFLNVFRLRKLLKQIRPDLLNAHYATGYGLLSVLACQYCPNVISLWGSDVYLFPKKSAVHSWVLNQILSRANAIFSTSLCMQNELNDQSLAKGVPVYITPFGVNTELFKPMPVIQEHNGQRSKIVIGTVKSLKHIYGIDVLLHAFGRVVREMPECEFELQIYGEGGEADSLAKLTAELGLSNLVFFGGFVPNIEVPNILNRFDLYVALSRSESFGVAVLEASSCELPVLVSDADGLCEVVSNRSTGLIVPIDDIASTTAALKELIMDPVKRRLYGLEGRKNVVDKYSETACIDTMIAAYKQVISASHHYVKT
ncbi:glycosyltransferase [Shewanella algidipiscicola]|uniref:Glycosyl transferase n=1 Tax=Shewanella algidipiscicola TaxID=614070 RepID=A0ABQ4NS91_9GAMM|nr:glycosyltransferase [Shewanella algidipiscicola]GIU01854.1 glycosyl transferase [Shewanella algidipiscicola]